MTYSVEAYYKEGEYDPVIVSSAEAMDSLLDALLAEPFGNSMATMHVRERPLTDTGFPDHELAVAVNSEQGVGGLRYTGDGQICYARGQTSDREACFYYFAGHDTVFPRDSEIPLDRLRKAVREFFETGGRRPSSVSWIPWPDNIQ